MNPPTARFPDGFGNSSALAMVPLCEECEEKCPYDLPIMQMIREHYELYLKHRAQVEQGKA